MKKWIIGSGIVVLVGLVVLFFATSPSDDELIRQAINESTEASREGKAGSVLDHLSRSLTFNGNAIADRGEIAKYVRLASPDVSFSSYQPIIDGDTATVKADVAINIDYQGMHMDQIVPGVEVSLARETGFRWVVFPASKWRITSVSAPDLSSFSSVIP